MSELQPDSGGHGLFDVVIPLYNKATTIERCLDSVVRQTLKPSTIVIVDDGSTDDSVAVLKTYVERNDLDVVLHRQENRGVSRARNKGVELSTNPFVCFLDADDEWGPRFLQRMAELIRDYPQANLYCLGHLVEEEGYRYMPPHGCDHGFRGYVEDFFSASARGSVANSSKVAVRRDAFYQCGGFPSDVRVGEDLFFWIQLALSGPVACDMYPEVTVYREPDEARQLRNAEVPYPLVYYAQNAEELKTHRSLRKYLARIGFFHVAGSVLNRDRVNGLRRARSLIKIAPMVSLAAFAVLLMPSRILRGLKRMKLKNAL